jgi:hypothetical protein
MKNHARSTLTLLAVSALFPAAAHAQFQIDWFTLDAGGGASAGGSFSLTGTVGQPDAAASAGGTFECGGGFWGGPFGGPACYANCDGSGVPPILNANDFSCFLNKFAGDEPYANCDGSTVSPVLTANDFQCFLNRFATGCS